MRKKQPQQMSYRIVKIAFCRCMNGYELNCLTQKHESQLDL
jgi:hypothetical protein